MAPGQADGLPAPEWIGADTDITGFLRDAVPAALRNAALRRAWLTDPVIAGHLDPARDYFWDFVNPASIPGHGPALAEGVAARLARAIRPSAPRPAAGADIGIEAPEDAPVDQVAPTATPAPTAAPTPTAPPTAAPDAPVRTGPVRTGPAPDSGPVAPRAPEPEPARVAVPATPRHGSASPA